jgi:hypothetical protein
VPSSPCIRNIRVDHLNAESHSAGASLKIEVSKHGIKAGAASAGPRLRFKTIISSLSKQIVPVSKMEPKFARDMPAPFTNLLTNIAIVGAGGRSGRHMVSSLLSTNKHTVAAITRNDSTSTMPEGVDVKKVDYDDHANLVSALEDQDVLIITLTGLAPPDTHKRLIDAAIEAGVKYIMPNEWGIDQNNPELAKDTLTGSRILPIRDYIESQSKGKSTHWVSVCCGFWYEFSLAGTEARYGFDFDKKSLTLFDKGDVGINTTTFPMLGRAVAALLSLKILPDDENDKSVCVSRWNDKSVYISSFFVSQNDMLNSVLRVTGDKKSDWTITHENTRERFARGQKLWAEGQVLGFGILLYTRTFFDDGAGDCRDKLDNELLGLGKGDMHEGKELDEATGWAVEMAAKGDTNALH